MTKERAPRWQRVYKDNRKTIGSNPNLIKPGQRLKMPDGSTHVVKKGENLTRIAASAGKSAAAPGHNKPAGQMNAIGRGQLKRVPNTKPPGHGTLPVAPMPPTRTGGLQKLPAVPVKPPAPGSYTPAGEHFGFHDTMPTRRTSPNTSPPIGKRASRG